MHFAMVSNPKRCFLAYEGSVSTRNTTEHEYTCPTSSVGTDQRLEQGI